MKVFLVLVIIVLLLVVGGWLVFDLGNDSATVRIDTDKIKEDAGQLMDRSQNVIDSTRESVERTTDPRGSNITPNPSPID